MRREPIIVRSVLSDQVRDHLLIAILGGEYAPGERIVETRVARELGVSQGPVREALRDLEALGMIESTPYQGKRVRKPSETELLEVYEVRAELESFGARLAVPRLSDANLLELEESVSAMQQAAQIGDREEQARIDVAFHTRVIELSGNHALRWVWGYLEPVSRTHLTFLLSGFDPAAFAALHRPIVRALRARDPASVVDAVHDHFRIAASLFEAAFVERSPFSPSGVDLDGEGGEQTRRDALP
jgi:DNA-binding GntR family transcriptional regulator